MIHWKRLGLVYSVENGHGWMNSHASLPFAVPQGENRYRIYFSCRDESNRSHGTSLDIELNADTFRILQPPSQPHLSPGVDGLFDDNGTTLSAYVRFKGEDLFYYTGWTLGAKAPYQTFCGLAKRSGSSTALQKFSRVPVLDRSELDPFSVGFVSVSLHENRLHMWYESNEGWATNDPTNGYRFVIRHATSEDGINWSRHDVDCIPHARGEYVISRPSVLFENKFWHMWYSRKENDKYLLGYAVSRDGIQWERRDSQAGLAPSGQGWDSDEIAYPFVFSHHGKKYLLYNGNRYGKTGFGLAVES